MGITGLLPLLKPACRPANLSQFKGCTVAIDVYCWLHKGAFGCAEQLAQGRVTDFYVRYVMKYINLLLYNNIKPILVFDGRNLPSKSETEKKRRTARKENREKAVQMLKEGKVREAREFFQRCVDITPAMAREVIQACRERNIDCIVAPYEADSQLAYLNIAGLADIVITEDSDLTLFGCDKVMFKLQDTGDGVLYERVNLGKVFGLRADSFSFDKFRYMCITAGCDYLLKGLPGIGLAKAKTFWQKVTNPDLKNVLRKIPVYLKMPNTVVSDEFIERFIKANNTFLYQLVFDPVTRKERPLTPYPPTLTDSPSSMTYCGSYSPPSTALQLALGNLDIHSLAQVTSFCPDNPPCPPAKPRYGARAGHSSVWCKGYQGVGSGGGGGGKMEKHATMPPNQPIFQSNSPQPPTTQSTSKFTFKSHLPPQPAPPPSSQIPFFEMGVGSGNSSKGVSEKGEDKYDVMMAGRGGEKRKSERVILPEDKIEEMLTGDLEMSPPHKKVKHGTEKLSKLKKLVGVTENLSKSGVVTVSKYFAGSETGRDKQTGNDAVKDTNEMDDVEDSPEIKTDPTVARGRRLSTGNSGVWFKDIEQPNSLQGKFIYRTEPSLGVGEQPSTGTVLKEISNSPEALGEDFERKKKRNPFAVKLKTKDFTSLPSSSPPLPTSNPPTPTSEPLPSSQLSLFSIDGASLTFSSQELSGSQENNLTPTPSQDGSPPSKQISSPPSSAPRLGLNKFAFSGGGGKGGSSSVIKSAPKSNFMPARVSGLSRGGKRGGGGGGGGMKQPSLLQMFARKCPKAQLGGGGTAGTD